MTQQIIPNNSLNLVDLDFDGLKASLKNFMRSQDQFKDYDFEGSNISVLLDLLAYNTLYNAFFTNMDISEGFIDSAQLRDTLVSHAKSLNYLPRSARSAKAKVRCRFSATGDNQPYTVLKGQSFTAQVKNKNFQFTVPEAIVCTYDSNNNYSFSTDIYEGTYIKDSYIFRADLENQTFRLTNKNADTTSITVTVYEDNAQVGSSYTYATTLLDLYEDSKVFFIQPVDNGFYEVLFGDGVVGRKPKQNAVIVIDYRVCKADAPIGAKNFMINFDPTNGDLTSAVEITTVTAAENGRKEESNESIRYYAPRHFQVQERTVVDTDYEIALKTKFPEINAVSVYGGEELTPPKYGRVYIALDIENIDGIPASKKSEYTQFIKRRNPMSITPIFVEAQMMYWGIESDVKYNINASEITSDRINTLVVDAILNYNEKYLNDFKSKVEFSRLIADIDDADLSILSNETKLYLYKKVQPVTNQSQNIEVTFDQPLHFDDAYYAAVHTFTRTTAVYSSAFTYRGSRVTLEDDGQGKIRLVKQQNNKHVTIVDVGTVNYQTGVVKLLNFNIEGFEGDSLRIYARPFSNDVYSTKNVLLTIEPTEINITPVPTRP